MDEAKKCKKNACRPRITKDILTENIFLHGGRQKKLIKHSSSMEEEGLFNKHLFSSMDDDTKNKK